MLLTALDDQDRRLLRVIAHTLIVILIVLPDHSGRILARLLAFQQCHVVDFLLSNGLGVRQLEAVEIDVFVRVVALVHLVEYLPRDVIVYLLLHFLVLLERYLLIDIGLVLARLVLLVDLLLQVLTYFFVLVNCLDLPLLFHLSLVHAIGLLAHRHYG